MRRVLVTLAVVAALTVGLGQAVPAHRTPTGVERAGEVSPGKVEAPMARTGHADARSLSVPPHIGTAVCVESVNGSPVRPCKRPATKFSPAANSLLKLGSGETPAKGTLSRAAPSRVFASVSDFPRFCATSGPRTICHGRQTAYRHAGPEFWWGRYQRERRLRVAAISSLRAETRKAARASQAHLNSGGSLYAIRLASALYNVPLNEMLNIARCETGGDYSPNAYNPSSGASGTYQFLASTWARAGIPGFSVFDGLANALAAARLYVTDGRSWHEWSCRP